MQYIYPINLIKSIEVQAKEELNSDAIPALVGAHFAKFEALCSGMEKAFKSKKPIFLDIISESEVNELPPVDSWLKAAQKKQKPILHT